MTYQELIANIRDLGFSDDDEVTEFGELVPNSINRAITEIATDMSAETPHSGTYEFTLTPDDTGTVYIDMTDDIVVPGGEGEPDVTIPTYFIGFADTAMMFKQRYFDEDGQSDPEKDQQFFSKFSDYDVMNHNTVILDADKYNGDFKILYKKAHTPFTGSSEELASDLPLPLKVHHLVPLLSAYYIWLEDEPSKAAQYYNLYEQKLTAIRDADNQPKLRILDGGL
jgi:hypothetical protein